MNYYEIEIKGKKYPVYYGMAALSEFLKIQGIAMKDLSNLTDNLSLDAIINIVLVGMKHGHRRANANIEFAFSHDDVADLIDEDFGIFEKCMYLFTEAMPKGDAEETGNGQAPAKRGRPAKK